jgi:MinD superfamily P-loop ATPase
MKVTIASGKGGTGKTTVAVNLAVAMKKAGRDVCLVDCDVEEPNCHLFFAKTRYDNHVDVSTKVPLIDEQKCTGCGLCGDFCAFNALACMNKKVLLYAELCHGCGGCWLVCPEEAISEVDRPIGKIQWGEREGFTFIEGRLNVGEPAAPPVVHATKEVIPEGKLAIIDGPPGTSCSMVETVRDSSLVILVAEPTPFGLNDLRLAVEVVRELDLPSAVVINKSGKHDGDIEAFCAVRSIPVIGKIPHGRTIAHHYASGDILYHSLPEMKVVFSAIAKDVVGRLAL